MKRKGLAVGIILLFIGISIIPSAPSEQTRCKKIITVDDEPGDADYTSIKEALNHSNPGDTIEVYSGTYLEHGINITNERISLIGIPHELGNGSDTGKPIIFENSSKTINIFYVTADNFSLINFEIADFDEGYVIKVVHLRSVNHSKISHNDFIQSQQTQTIIDIFESNYVEIQNNTLKGGQHQLDIHNSHDCLIMNNSFTNCSGEYGLNIEGNNLTIFHNVIIGHTSQTGVFCFDSNFSIKKNFISNCEYAVEIGGDGDILVENNEFRKNIFGLTLVRTRRYTTLVTKNNFIENQVNALFVGRLLFSNFIFRENFWSRSRILPKPIFGLGFIILGISPGGLLIGLPVPWLCFDLHPAQKPYDIPRMR